MPDESASRTNRTAWLPVFLILFSIHLFFFSGRFHTIDEMALLTTTENMVKWGHVDINALAWEQWFLRGPDQQGLFNAQGDLFAKKAPLVSWLAAPVYALAGAVGGRQAQVSFLLNDLVSAATGAVLFVFVLRLGYRRKTAVWAALLYGLGTSALVYARTLFGEPLAGLGLLLAVLGIWRVHAGRDHAEPDHAGRGLTWAGTGLAVAALTNPVYFLAVPVFLAANLWSAHHGRGFWNAALRMLWPVGIALGALAVWNTARFGAPWISGYHFHAGEGFSSPLWISLPAMLVSPARGLLWFVPAVILSLAGAHRFLRQQRRLAWTILALAVAHLLIFGAWWMWWGGWGWGPRFLTPLSPLLVLLALPVLEHAGRGPGWQKLGIAAVIGISVLVQVLGATVGFDEFEMNQTLHHLAQGRDAALYAYGTAGLWNWGQSPILGHLKLLLSGASDLAWRPAGGTDWPMLLALLIWIGFGAWVLAREFGKRPLLSKRRYPALALSALFLVVVLWRAGQHPLKASYGLDPSAGVSALNLVARESRPGDGALLVRSLTMTEMYNYSKFPRVYGVPYGDLPGAEWDNDLIRLVENARARHGRVWLVVRSASDRIAAQIDGRLKQEMRRSDWVRVEGYEIALYLR